MAIHKPFWAESKAKIVSRLDHSGYYLNIEEVVHHLLVQDPQIQNLTSIYSLPAPQYLNIKNAQYLNIEEVVHHLLVQDPRLQNLTSIYSLPAPQYLNISTSISISQYQGYHLYIFVASASTPS